MKQIALYQKIKLSNIFFFRYYFILDMPERRVKNVSRKFGQQKLRLSARLNIEVSEFKS